MRRSLILPALLFMGLIALGRPPLAAEPPQAAPAAGALREALVDVPRETRIPLEIPFEKAAFVGVESHNEPQESDVKEAAAKDPKDKTVVLLRFFYRNEGYVKHKVRIQAVLLGPDGEVLGEGGRRSSLDPQQKEDTISFPMKIRTLDWPRAQKLRVIATFLD